MLLVIASLCAPLLSMQLCLFMNDYILRHRVGHFFFFITIPIALVVVDDEFGGETRSAFITSFIIHRKKQKEKIF